MASVWRRVAIVLIGLLRAVCSLGTWVLHGVCHTGACFSWAVSCHCSFHLDSSHILISTLASVRASSHWLLEAWHLLHCLLCCCPHCQFWPLLHRSDSAFHASVASLAAAFARS